MKKPARIARSAASPVKARSAKREHLLDVARGLFARQGYHAVGIDTVLAEAGVAKMTLYKHFPSKEALIAAVLERRAAEIVSEIEAKVSRARGGAAGRVLAVFDWLDDWFRSPGFHGCLFIKAASEYPEESDLPRQAAVAFKAGCLALLQRLCGELELSGTRRNALARQLALLIEGATVLAFIQRSPAAAAEAKDAARVLVEAATAA
ncbi:MAG: TetR/AcrR family transcriptional regulator [Candidatus Didemnitutus sp.]|nr:TetR/AcrR family transcriptional regulator [Candidatus Didemnitutus sp.]